MASLPTPSCKELPVKIGVVLFPGFQNIDVFGPLDVFWGASWYIPGLEVYLLSHDLTPVSTKLPNNVPPLTYGFEIKPTHTFSNPPHLDVLLVPGGLGAMAGLEDPVLCAARSFVYHTYPKLKYLLTVCLGSALIAPTGLLDDKKATTNKQAWDWGISQGKKVHWQRKARWVVDGNIWTGSGVTAGIDLAFAWIGYVFDGKGRDVNNGNAIVKDIGKAVAKSLEYVRDTDPNNDPFAIKDDHDVDENEEEALSYPYSTYAFKALSNPA